MMCRRIVSRLGRCHACRRQPTLICASPAALANNSPVAACTVQAAPLTTSASNYHNLTRSRHQDPFALSYSVRSFSSRRRKGKLDPFKVLKVRRKTPYSAAKKIFLQVAMQHHPDTSSAKTEEEAEKSQELFIRTRQAFEALAEDPETGGICLKEELADYEAPEEHLDEWFKKETGFDMPFMDEETMKEVANMTDSMGGGGMDRGLDRDGGMWELARMVTRTVKSGGDGKNLLKLEAGEIKETEINDGNLRARRRRNW